MEAAVLTTPALVRVCGLTAPGRGCNCRPAVRKNSKATLNVLSRMCCRDTFGEPMSTTGHAGIQTQEHYTRKPPTSRLTGQHPGKAATCTCAGLMCVPWPCRPCIVLQSQRPLRAIFRLRTHFVATRPEHNHHHLPLQCVVCCTAIVALAVCKVLVGAFR